MVFRDRSEAGRRLGAALQGWQALDPVVLGMARGGAVVGTEVAQALDAPFDVCVAGKVGAPRNPEYAVGAVAPGATWVDESMVHLLDVPREYLSRAITAASEELERRESLYHGSHPALDVTGRTVILVDDGLATGATARAAVASLRRRGAARIIFAAPVGCTAGIARLHPVVDDVIILAIPWDFHAVSQAYREFAQVEDEAVLELLGGVAA